MHSNVYLPSDFLQHIEPSLPVNTSLEQFIACCQTPLRKSIRVNTVKIKVSDFCDIATTKGWRLTPVPWCSEGFWVERPKEEESALPLGNTAEHLCGLFYIQEASSMMPPEALFKDLNEYELVLDMAAAPGSKSTQLAALMNNEGCLVANELSSSRVKVLAANIQRCGVMNSAISHFDAAVFGQWLPESFDAVLLDAPCSGEGAIRKDEAAMKNWSLEALNNMSDVQKALAKSAFHALKVGGELVYSTCTLSPEENQQVCEHILSTFSDAIEVVPLNQLFAGAEQCATPEGYLHVWPQVFDSEGFFVARFRKLKPIKHELPPTRKAEFPYQKVTRKMAQEICQYFHQQFGLTLPAGFELYQREKTVWLFPVKYTEIMQHMRFQRGGLRLAELHNKGMRISHDAVMAFAKDANKNRISLTEDELIQYFRGQDIASDHAVQQGEVILFHGPHPVGSGKGLKGKIKNALPRELVRNSKLISWV